PPDGGAGPGRRGGHLELAACGGVRSGRGRSKACVALRVRLIVAYNGALFHGFAIQPGQLTVAGALKASIDRALRADVTLVGAGRTDTGVHAWGQVVTFDAEE